MDSASLVVTKSVVVVTIFAKIIHWVTEKGRAVTGFGR